MDKLKKSTKTIEEAGEEMLSHINDLLEQLKNENLSEQDRACINEKIDLLEVMLDDLEFV